jgi:FlaA1/EpsC-like NDP-sugar epimerase/uncharacterized protein involved in exopolysaccharide biosynthesis
VGASGFSGLWASPRWLASALLENILYYLLLSLPVKSILVWAYGLHLQAWSRFGFRDLWRLGQAVAAGTLLHFLGTLLLGETLGMPRSVPLLEGGVAFLLMGVVRFLVRRYWERTRASGAEGTRVLIVGAGDAGSMVARELLRHPEAGLLPVGFLDDDPNKRGQTLMGLKVWGPLDQLPAAVRALGAEEVLIAMPSAPGSVVRKVVELARRAGVRHRILPALYEVVSNSKEITASQIREVRLEDLLRREPVKLDVAAIASYLQDRVVMVTGAGGSIGSEIVRQVARFAPKQVLLVGKGENSLFLLEEELKDRFPSLFYKVLVADVRDRERMDYLFRTYQPEVVFHAAAHKHVPMMEANPDEAVFNNVVGTRNVVQLCLDYGVERLVNISTDKAVNPTSVMGASKRVAEMVVAWGASRAGVQQHLVSVRFGNVLGSRGSVVPIFMEQIRNRKPVTVTHPEVKRYFMTIPEAAQLVLQAGGLGGKGTVYVLMVETPQDELSLRDIVEVLRRHRVYLWAFPLILAALALIYGFLIAEPTYASTATLSVAPVQVQVQLEQRIQVQQATPITFEGLKALALSEETVGEVWEALRKEGRLPTRWQDRGGLRGIERMMRDLKVKDISPKLQAVNPNQVFPIVASLTVQAPDPQVAAKAANLWMEAVKRRVNAIPLARLEASLKALEEQVTPAEKAYREAQARWEAFNKTTTLPQDKAELDAKTQERVGLDTELAGQERDLAAVQGRIQATLAEMRRQEAIVPIGTPPEQLAIINRRLAEAQASLARELERVRQSYVQAAQVLEKFKGREQIPVWQAELSAYTEAYASAQARLIALQKDLAQKQALLQDAEARLAEYKAQLPNLSIENLVAGLTVKEAEALVADRLKEADSRLKAAEGAWAEFQRKSQLEVWKRQLGGYADRVASIRQRLESLATDRFRVEADLGEARRRFDQYKAQLPNLSIENLVAGLTVKEAEALVADRLKEADSRLKAAEGAWAEFQRKSQLEVWKRQLGGYADRVASIRQRLESLATERAIKQTRLEEAEKELAKEPRLITLEREITADPAVAAAIAQGGNLRDLLGLKLKNQELNPTHLKLLSTALDLRADLAALDREEKALKEEEAKLAPLVQDLQRRIADEEALRARLLTELDTARDIYNAVYRYAESLKKVASRPDVVLREVNPDVLAYRDRIVDLEARLVALKAEEEALKEEEAKLAPLVQDLQRRIADEEATRERLLTELETARDIYNAVYRYAESLKKVASRPDVVLAGGEPGRAGLPGPGGGPQGRDRRPEGGGGSPEAEPHRAGRAHPRPQGQDRRPGAGEGGRDPGVRHQEGGLRGLP